MPKKMTGDALLGECRRATKVFIDAFESGYEEAFRILATNCQKAEQDGVDPVLIKTAAMEFLNGLTGVDKNLDAIMDRVANEIGWTPAY